MRIIDRLHQYLQHYHIAPYTFERKCGIANGYLKKQDKGRGTIGSEIIEKIISTYKDLSLIWLITGKGKMLLDLSYPESEHFRVNDEKSDYSVQEQTISLLREKIGILENSLADKEKIIRLLEIQLTNTAHN